MLSLEIEKVRPLHPHFDGDFYDPNQDHERLTLQMDNVLTFMQDHRWHTVQEVAAGVHAPENSTSAQLRNLRKERFGRHQIQTVRGGPAGLFLYRLRPSNESFRMSTAMWDLAKKYGIECHRHENELVLG